MRILPIIAMLFLVAACAAIPPPMGSSSTGQSPRLEGNVFITRDGVRLPLSEWDAKANPGGGPRAIILGLHGMSDYANAFAMPAKIWAADGITTLAYDQRGFGRGPQPGSWAGGDILRQDLDDFAVAARARYPHLRIYALGESMGGAVLLTALEKAPPAIDGAILSAPAVWSRADMPLSYRVALFVVAHLAPGLVLSNNAGARVVHIVPSDNIPMLIALGKDPYFQKHTDAAALFGLVNLMDDARQAPTGIVDAPPILLMTGARDQLIPRPPTEAVIAALGSRATVQRYPSGYHMLLRDLEGAKVAGDVAAWVLKQAGEPAPDGTRKSETNP